MSRKKDEAALAPHPRLTSDLIGQAEAEKQLIRAVESGRLPHAWLISGPRGIGKATLAYRFTRYLLSKAKEGQGNPLFSPASPQETLAVSMDHPVSRQIAAGSHPDVFVLERAAREDGRLPRDIDVASVRQLNAFLRMTSSEGGWRIAIVDSADEMNANAANALLKVLEEPPEAAVLLLVSHAPGRLLPTIRSRCRRLALTDLREEEVVNLLRGHLPEAEREQLVLLARLAEGSIGRALTLAEEGGASLYEDLLELLSTLPKIDTAKAHAFADMLARNNREQRFQTAAQLLLWWLGRLIESGASSRAADPVIGSEWQIAQQLLSWRPLAEWLALWENLGRLFDQAERASLDRKQVMLTALNRLAGQGPAGAV